MKEAIINTKTGEVTFSDLSEEEIKLIEERRNKKPSIVEQQRKRQVAYREESDPLFFKVQRNETSIEEWKSKVEEIRARYPYS